VEENGRDILRSGLCVLVRSGRLRLELMRSAAERLSSSVNRLFSPESILNLQEGLLSAALSSEVTSVADVATVVVAVEPGGSGETCSWTSCCSSVVLWAFSCCCFFFTSCSADFKSSKVTPWVERLVSLTRLACAFLWISCSSSRTGGTKDRLT